MFFCTHWNDDFLPRFSEAMSPKDFGEAKRYWEGAACMGAYGQAFAAARAAKYHELAQLLPSLCHMLVRVVHSVCRLLTPSPPKEPLEHNTDLSIVFTLPPPSPVTPPIVTDTLHDRFQAMNLASPAAEEASEASASKAAAKANSQVAAKKASSLPVVPAPAPASPKKHCSVCGTLQTNQPPPPCKKCGAQFCRYRGDCKNLHKCV